MFQSRIMRSQLFRCTNACARGQFVSTGQYSADANINNIKTIWTSRKRQFSQSLMPSAHPAIDNHGTLLHSLPESTFQALCYPMAITPPQERMQLALTYGDHCAELEDNEDWAWEASSTVKKRRLKMNKHKYRKRRKRDRQRSK